MDAAINDSNYRYFKVTAAPSLLAGAEPWSSFNPVVHDSHYAALRQVLQSKRMSH